MQNFGVTNKEHYAYVMIFSGVVNWPFAQLSQYTLLAPTPPKKLCITFVLPLGTTAVPKELDPKRIITFLGN